MVTGAGNLTVSTGTSGQFSANTVVPTGTFTLDQSANVAGSASLTLGAVSASGAINISGPAGSGDLTITSVTGHSTFTLDASSFGGSIDLANASVGGNVGFIGPEGHFSASVIGTNASITLDAANATTGQITMQKLSAGAGITVSMGAGSGGISMVSSVTNGNFTLDASNFGGTIDINTITASGAVVVSFDSTEISVRMTLLRLEHYIGWSCCNFWFRCTEFYNGWRKCNRFYGFHCRIPHGYEPCTLKLTLDASKFGGAVDVTTLTLLVQLWFPWEQQGTSVQVTLQVLAPSLGMELLLQLGRLRLLVSPQAEM